MNRIKLSLLVASILLCCTGVAAEPSATPPRQTYLLLDSRVVERTEHARLTVGTVVKHPANPLFGEDKPWEVRFDNLYANILWDSEAELFKCWYSPFVRDVKHKPPMSEWDEVSYVAELRKLKGAESRKMGICYATSKDGIRWDKPDLGLVEFDGSKANNLVWLDPHGAGIFKDLAESDPQRRYKMITAGQPHGRLSRSYSPDGLHWSALQEMTRVKGDTHNNAFWDPIAKQYVAITRESPGGIRTVVRLESDDFIQWSEPKEVLRGPKSDQTYSMPVIFQHGVFLGLIGVFHTQEDRVTTELAWSPDTVNWHRIDEGTPLLPLSERRGDYDWGCAYAAAAPVVMPDGEIRIYYGASNGRHTSWRDGFLALATLRPDGWAGYACADSATSATVVTRLVTCKGKTLCLSADAQGGEVVVRVRDSSGRVLAKNLPLTGNVTAGPVLWPEGFNLADWADKAVQLEFTLTKARLYSFSFKD